MADATVIKIALTGLLHDIGKLAQRANLEKVYPEIIANNDEFCPPLGNGMHCYHHAAYTAFFITKYIPEGLFDKGELYNGAGHHKSPRRDIYKEADILSTGMERFDTEAREGKLVPQQNLWVNSGVGRSPRA